ncbi:unnamed protein product [Hermetia illucens]|uniref:Uncharacterized protein n=1 Tax=Hermetia illucens TaxID=343691 RepID=A0A7R8YSH3_HERIL|nr:unnamed protein product [Hermetia illucens]
MADTEIEKVIQRTEYSQWRLAQVEEAQSHLEYKTWELMRHPEREKAIGSRALLKNKMDADGNIEREKTCIAARGFSQKPGCSSDMTGISKNVSAVNEG